ncbi:hypothetical protein ATPR_2192 [Acetobacter tropicalis NBRC 101654]|uniref:Uncharacterized protein n=1 Tax=Acetobacter tropicalis NBRC 101654 TaxID=749388 RepID=F7VFP3_9PROT|nr:hypothetical protein ATPR_2192 [Acetobacter tropicalis NBRC 101654]
MALAVAGRDRKTGQSAGWQGERGYPAPKPSSVACYFYGGIVVQ